jgi:hypothetical protein
MIQKNSTLTHVVYSLKLILYDNTCFYKHNFTLIPQIFHLTFEKLISTYKIYYHTLQEKNMLRSDWTLENVS